MMNRDLLFISIYFLFFSSCKKADSSLRVIPISTVDISQIEIATIANSLQLVQLETNKNSLLGNISDVKIYNDKIFIVDKIAGVSIFDMKGVFIQNLGRKGDGPGEFDTIYHMTIDENSGLIYIASGYKILIFSLDYEFIQEKKFPFLLHYLFFKNGYLNILSKDLSLPVENGFVTTTLIFELNSNLELLDSTLYNKVILKNRTIAGYQFKHYFSENTDHHYFYFPVLTSEGYLRDTLYKAEYKTFIPFIKFQFDTPVSIDQRGFQSLLILNIIKSESYLIVEFDKDFKRMIFFYDLRKNEGLTVKEGFLDQDGNPLIIRPLNLSEDTFYFVKSSEYQNTNTEEKNPVIGIVKLNQ